MLPKDRSAVRGSLVRRASAVAGIVALLLAVACPPSTPPPASAPNKDVACARQFTGVPYDNDPPTVDGILAGDLGWTNAFRYVNGNGSSVPDMAFQMIRDDAGKALYLAFEVHNDNSFDDQDAILITFSPGPTAANDRRIIIFPLFDGVGAAASGAPADIQYWVNSSTWNTPGTPPTATPGWLSSNIKATSDGASKSWFVEVKIPIAATAADPGINLPSGTEFPFSVNVFRWYKAPPVVTVVEYPWPAGAGLVGGATAVLQQSTPAPASWGKGKLTNNNDCNGVSFAWYDIAIQHPVSSTATANQIALNQPNDFTVTPHNDAVDATNTYVIAPQVFARFRIANWGINTLPSWGPVAIGTNDETPTKNIPAAAGTVQGSDKLVFGNWSVPAGDVPKYQANPHQCVMAELDSKASGVAFKNRSATTNMDFVTASSPFVDTATIGLKGLRWRDSTGGVEMFLSAHAYNTPSDMRWETQLTGVTPVREDVFLLRGKDEKDVPLPSSVLPPSVTIPTQEYRAPPDLGAPGGQPLAIAVRPGNLVTILAEGGIVIRRTGEQTVGTSPAGVDLGERARREKFPVDSTLSPWSRAGALIGSWDRFEKTGFFLGTAATLKVPRDARELTVAINDSREGFAQHGGEGYRLQVIQTPLEPYFAVSHPEVGLDPAFQIGTIPPGSNLPTWILCGQAKTGRKLTAGNVTGDLLEAVGCYGSMVTRIGR